MSRNLVIYFSRVGENYFAGSIRPIQKGNTEIFAQTIAKAVDADLFKVEPAREYAFGYYACCDQSQTELSNRARPQLKNALRSVENYDNIFIGYPIWWGTVPMPILAQLEKLNFKGKTVIPFSTHEGSGLGKSVTDIKKACVGATIKPGLAIQGTSINSSAAKITTWAKESVK